jgi:hypothetical protein
VAVRVSGGGFSNSPFFTLDAAFAAIGTTTGNFTVTLFEDVTLANRTISSGQNITLTGSGEMRTINHSAPADGLMFTLNANGSGLTLGNNITLQGTSGRTGVLINVENGTLAMQTGSRITGHGTSAREGAVHIAGANARFDMTGGIINGNTTSHGTTAASAGVFVLPGGVFNMTGGEINNGLNGTGLVSDVHIISTAAEALFTMAGGARIGHIKLWAESGGFSKINIGAGLTGNVGTLHLRGNGNMTSTTTLWGHNNQVLQGANGHTLTAADVSRFTLGNFMPGTALETQSIGNTHMLGVFGDNRGRLLALPAGNGGTNPFIIMNEDHLRMVGRGGIYSTSANYSLGANITLTTPETAAFNLPTDRFPFRSGDSGHWGGWSVQGSPGLGFSVEPVNGLTTDMLINAQSLVLTFANSTGDNMILYPRRQTYNSTTSTTITIPNASSVTVNLSNLGVWTNLGNDLGGIAIGGLLHPDRGFWDEKSLIGAQLIYASTGDPDNNWTPIPGTFTGTFDGAGRTISGMTINDNGNNQGMFRSIGRAGRVTGLNLTGVNIQAGNGRTVGGITAVNDGTITHSTVAGTVSGAQHVGGIAGDNHYLIEFCSTSADVTSVNPYSNAGGIVGYNVGGPGRTPRVLNCFSTGNIAADNNAGGIVGRNHSNGSTATVQFTYATGSVTISGHDPDLNGAGGIAGNLQGGLVRDSVALNSSVTAPNIEQNAHRVIGVRTAADAGSLFNNHGRDDLSVTGDTPNSNNVNYHNGGNIAVAQWGNVGWWRTTAFNNMYEPSDAWQWWQNHLPPGGISGAMLELDLDLNFDLDFNFDNGEDPIPDDEPDTDEDPDPDGETPSTPTSLDPSTPSSLEPDEPPAEDGEPSIDSATAASLGMLGWGAYNGSQESGSFPVMLFLTLLTAGFIAFAGLTAHGLMPKYIPRRLRRRK